jgi:inorganic pyrophosphatase
MALLDEGETDWKIIAIDVNDPLAPKLNDIEDVERHLPGLLRATNEFWRIYKVLSLPFNLWPVVDLRSPMVNKKIRLHSVGNVRIRNMLLKLSRNAMKLGNVLLPEKLNLLRV